MSKTRRHARRPFYKSDHGLSLFGAAAAHVCLGLRTAGVIVEQMKAAAHAREPGRSPFIVHAAWARFRGVQHRNTSRNVLHRLEKVGLLVVDPYRPGRPGRGFLPTRFRICMYVVKQYVTQDGVGVLKSADDKSAASMSTWDKVRGDHVREREAQRAERAKRYELACKSKSEADERAALRNIPTPRERAVMTVASIRLDPDGQAARLHMNRLGIRRPWLELMSDAELINHIIK